MFGRMTLKRKLMTVFAVLAIAGIGMTLFMAWNELRVLRIDKVEATRAGADNIMDKIDRNLFERYGDVQAFALSEPARSLIKSHITDFMTDMMAAYAPIYDVMMVVDLKGRVVAVNQVDKAGKPLDSSSFYGKNYSEAAWFKAAVEDKIPAGSSFVEDLRVDADVAAVLPATQGRVMNFTAAIRDKRSKKVIGVWTNRVSWADVVEAITKEEVQKLKGDAVEHVFPFLVNAEGTFLLNSNQDLVLKGKIDVDVTDLKATFIRDSKVAESEFKGAGIQAISPSRGYSIYPSRGWRVGITVPAYDKNFKATIYMIVGGMLVLLICGFGANRMVSSISTTINDLNVALSEATEQVTKGAQDVQGSAGSLAESNSEQAAAIEETVASTEEMTSMVSQTSHSAETSVGMIEQSNADAQRGMEVVERLSAAMSDIESNNNRLNDIVKLIEEIQTKTRVINDIVFETRLLSFNASIEAARAGIHGKGFAVVAEEVGKLASMSGRAADEIRQLLDSSTKEVSGAVKLTQEKVTVGRDVSEQCSAVFKTVTESMARIMTSVRSIASATKEQQTGIEQTNKAMQEMDKVTQRNAGNSETLSGLATHLGNGAANLSQSVRAMRQLVNGTTEVATGPTTSEGQGSSQPASRSEAATTGTTTGRTPAKLAARPPAGEAPRGKTERVSRNDSRFKKAS